MGHDEKCARSARIAAIVATAVCPRKIDITRVDKYEQNPSFTMSISMARNAFARGNLCVVSRTFPALHNGVWGRWWRQTGSNRRPEACKATALPTELCPQLDLHPATALNLAAPRQTWWAWEDSNFRPHAYQARALTN